MKPARDRKRSFRMIQLWLLVLLFALPPLAAWLFYLNPQWLPKGHTNHGELISPARPLEPLLLKTADGAHFDWQPLKDKWTLTLLATGRCDAACTERLIKVRQIRRALGANRQRVERLLIMLPDQAGNLEPPTLEGLEGTILTFTQDAKGSDLQNLFEVPRSDSGQSLFLIDPRIELMMVHDMSRISSKQVLQDLEKLLKASQNWVKGGQYGHK